MKTTVYLIRHAEAEGNAYRRCHGQYDSLLTPRGYEQLPYLAARFIDIPLDAVYASDLFRARTTAAAIAEKKGMTVALRPALREIDMGVWEDLPWAELPRLSPAEYKHWKETPWCSTPPGGESVMGAGQRMLDGVRELVRAHEGGAIAVVTHGSAIRGALTLAHGYAPEQMGELGWGDNTCVAKLIFDGDDTEVVYQNDASHLPFALSTFASIGWKDDKGVPETLQIWFRPADPDDAQDAARIVDYMREMYRNAYGSDQNLHPDALLDAVRAARAVSERAVTFGVLESGETVALVYLNAAYTDEPNVGLVGGLCIDKAYRGHGLSQQIVGQGISVFRALGKEYLVAHVAEGNARARGFYHKFAFEPRGSYENENGTHLRMFKRIAVD